MDKLLTRHAEAVAHEQRAGWISALWAALLLLAALAAFVG